MGRGQGSCSNPAPLTTKNYRFQNVNSVEIGNSGLGEEKETECAVLRTGAAKYSADLQL